MIPSRKKLITSSVLLMGVGMVVVAGVMYCSSASRGRYHQSGRDIHLGFRPAWSPP